MHRNNFLTLVLMLLLALGSFMAIAQVTVNAPDKLTRRGGTKTAPKEAPAASAPATSTPATSTPAASAPATTATPSTAATPSASSAGTAAAPRTAPATTSRRASSKKNAVGQAPSNYTPRGASYMPSRSAAGTVDPAAGAASGKKQSQITGYRVQVLFSSDKKAREKARNRAKEVALKYPSYKCYLSYVAPQWRLRFGDFKYRADANTAMQRFCRAFPQFRKDIIVVQDKINVR